MNTRLSFTPATQPSRRATRAEFSPVRSVRTVQAETAVLTADQPETAYPTSARAKNVRIPSDVRLGLELAPYTPSPTRTWPAWHRGALDRLQAPLTRYRE